jgi:acyl-CoA synthetase (AMP-forming)/AMP-acid ligase II
VTSLFPPTFQVKVGGVRIELGEIEAVLLRLFPKVPHVAVEKIDGRLVGVVAAPPEDQHAGTGDTAGLPDNTTGGRGAQRDGPGTQTGTAEDTNGTSPGGRALQPDEIQSALAAELPPSMVPAEWLFREALPLGSAGKVDHAKTVAWVRDQARAAVWGSVYDELYFAQDLQVRAC